ncbi:hypothetical protein CDL15_Pgr013785 [Punica granatum]|nr:hypothetical protein CDL15_Pgr013785 [Punica granatum]
MDIPSNWASYTAAWLATLALILLSRRFCRGRQLNLPPGPKPWPIIGNLNLIGPLPHHSIHELSKKYGSLMSLRFGSFPLIVASSAEMARAILKTHDATFAGRPKFNVGKYITYNYSNITWSEYGPYWRQARKISMMELFSPKRLESYRYIREEEMKAFLHDLFDMRESPVTLIDHLSDLSLNVISRMVLGKKYTQKTDGSIMNPEKFKKMINEVFVLSGGLSIGDSIPWINFLDLDGYIKRMKAVSKKFDRFLEHVLDEHNERERGMEDYVAKDMVDVLLQLADDPNLEVKLERHGVKAFILDFIAGGTDTSAVTVEWAMSELLRKPEIIERATEELNKVIGKERWVQETDIVNLPYINAITKEAMRLHPVVPMLIPRLCREDCKIGDYDIPKRTRALVSVWTIGRDPEIWGDPDEFRPERFIWREIDVKGQDIELLPFGSGRRMCPGYTLGLKMVHGSLANLLHGFEWKLPGEMRPGDLDMEEVFGLTTPRKVPLLAVPKPRLPPHLYSMY